MAAPIEDYAIIGDTQTAALVCMDGSIDWLCVPRFDSGACFAALLGDQSHGHWQIGPADGSRARTRSYRKDTLVLETDFATDEGGVRVIDCMPLRDRSVDVVRIVVGLWGRMPMRMRLVVRFDYGQVVPWVRTIDGVLRLIAGPDALALHTPIDTHGEDLTTVAEFTVNEGDHVPFVLSWFPSHHDMPSPIDATRAVARTTAWWQAWSARSVVASDYSEAVHRSAITLKALTYAPTGGIVAAPTTSLPEWIGSVRNWDYRYCWLRDATFTLYALMNAGYSSEAKAWRDWLLRAVAGDPGQLQIMYGPAGERRLTELELGWLPGYEASAPVRIGNGASDQYQLDVYGEVLDGLRLARQMGISGDTDSWGIERAILDFLEDGWRQPDEGIWEVRGARQHFTFSKVMAWVGFDRAVKSVEQFGLDGPVDRWRQLRADVHREVLDKAYDHDRNTFVQAYDSKLLDASVLMIPLVGFLPVGDERVVGTVQAIQEALTTDGFVARYDSGATTDGLPPGEGVFLPCSFWLADNLALLGRTDDATTLYERLLGCCNDVGLLSEEYDPVGKRLLGNFPQAFTHVSLVNTACNLAGDSGPAHHRAAYRKPPPG